MPQLAPLVKAQFFDANGNPLASGKVHTYATGTSTPKTTYSDAGGTANANPIILNARGEADIWLDSDAAYRFVVKDSADNTIWTKDDIATGSNPTIATVATVAALKALTGGAFPTVTVLGYYAAGDGGGGLFRWSSADTSTDNAGTIIAPNAGGTGRWNRIYDQASAINVKWFGAKGDGVYAGEATAIQAAIDLLTTGGRLYFPLGTYLVSNLSITKSGIRFLGESENGTTLKITTGSAGTYIINVNLSGVGPARPLGFCMDGFTIEGDSASSRTYRGLMLRNVYKPDLRNIRYTKLSKCLTLRAAYYGTFAQFWFDNYGTGIEGYDAAESGNANTFLGMQFIEGNDAGDAVPWDGTFLTDNTVIDMSVGSSVSLGNASIKSGDRNTFIGMRMETITSTSDWMTVANKCRIVNPEVGSQVALASGKYVFKVTGHSNVIECSLAGSNILRVVRLDSTSKYNDVKFEIVTPTGSYPVLDLGKHNALHFGAGDHMVGNDNGAACVSWSDREIENLIVNSINFGGTWTLDGLANTLDNTIRGPNNKGGVYRLDTPAGNRQITQSIGSFGANSCFCISFWAKAVSGGEGVIQACLSESPSSDYFDVTITSDQWTRVIIITKFSNGPFTRRFGVRLPVAHPGIYWYGPQVVNLGDNAVSGEVSPVYVGGYVPTLVAIRRDPAPRDPHRFQAAAPTGGLWYRGDRVIDLACAAGSTSPGLVCITDGEPGTWKAEANVAA